MFARTNAIIVKAVILKSQVFRAEIVVLLQFLTSKQF